MSKKSRKHVPRKPTTRHARVVKRFPRHEDMAREIVARVDLVPSYPDIFDGDEERALVAAFIEHQINDDSRAEMQSYEADQDRDEKILMAALPAALHPVFARLLTSRDTRQWIKEEVAHTLGIEMGRRLAGEAR